MVNYDKLFPEEDKPTSQVPTLSYAIRLSLVAPKDDYDLTGNCKDIDIHVTFNEAVKRYNSHPPRLLDGGKIIDVVVRRKDIVFTLVIRDGYLSTLPVRNLLGNTICKWLKVDWNYGKLSHDPRKLFHIEYLELTESTCFQEK